ncbi:MAG: sterol desaturase family protein [Bacteroidia bacterium]
MPLNPIVLSIPIFFILIGLEVFYDRVRKKGVYRFNDALTNISCGITEQVSGVFAKVFTVTLYYLVYEHVRLFTVPTDWYWLVLLFLMVDFAYYWAHRWSHEVNLFWAGHVVHHQSEEYNLSVALRQGVFQKFFTSFIYLPIALLGFDPYWFLLLAAFNTLYQFWIHTQFIGRMGWLEYVLNTPSHHRVHHGRDPKYIDKNHAGSLIIWDKMFGTFQAEEESPNYGITSPVNSWNPVFAQVQHLGMIWQDVNRVQGLANKFRVIFGKPGWLPESMGGYRKPEVVAPNYQKFDTEVPLPVNVYVLLHYLFMLAGTSYFLFNLNAFNWTEKGVFAGLIFLTSASLGLLLENHKQARKLERVRLLLTTGILIITIGKATVLLLATCSISLIGLKLLDKSLNNTFHEKMA